MLSSVIVRLETLATSATAPEGGEPDTRLLFSTSLVVSRILSTSFSTEESRGDWLISPHPPRRIHN